MFFKPPIAVYTNNFKIRILRKSGVLQISSWSHIKINYYIQSTSENQTFGFQTVPKSQQSAVRYGLVRISNVRDQSYTVRYLNIQISDSWDQNPDWLKSERSVWPFGPNCLKSERSDFRQLGPKGQTECSNTEQYSFGPERSKSEQDHTEQLIVWISALSKIRTFGFRTLTVYK